jgi:UDP-N-acetylglucosamine 3-dehydrogenase
MMCFPENKGAIIETNWLTPNKVRTLNITGTEGIIDVEYITQSITLENQNQIIQPFLIWDEPLRLELESFIHSLVYEKEPIVTGEDGLKALKVCEAAIESARIGKPVINDPRSGLQEFLID